MKRFDIQYLATGCEWLVNHSLLTDIHGKIVAVLPQAQAATWNVTEVVNLNQFLVIPGCVNSHSHAFQVLLRPTTGQPQHFRDWVDRFLYPLVARLNDEQLYTSALLAFAEMARAGITTVGEFFYVHNGPQGESLGNHHAELVIQAARHVGIRIALIRTLYDQGQKAGQKRFKESVESAIGHTRELWRRFQAAPDVTVLPAPHSLHGASAEMIQAGAALAAEMDTPWHIHLAEQQHDQAFALEKYHHTPVQLLEQWGILDHRTVLVHAIWLEAAEKQLMGQRNVGVAYNPITNMALGDGIADIPGLLAAGVNVSLGTDANIRQDLFAEAQAVEYLQRVKSLEMGRIPTIQSLFKMLNANGGQNLGLPVGQLQPDYWADFLVIDPQDLSMLPVGWSRLEEIPTLNQLLFAMVPHRAISQVYVAGREIVADGVCLHLGDNLSGSNHAF